MNHPLSQDLLLSPGKEDQVWELYHENSKLGQNSSARPEQEILKWMTQLHESLPFEGYPAFDLPQCLKPLKMPLEEVITARVSERNMQRCKLTLENLAHLLRHSYGITRNNMETRYPRPFRAVPSGGGLYPLEIFFHSGVVEGLSPGLYHYNPLKNNLRLIRNGDLSAQIVNGMVYPELAWNASLMIFITAIFERSIFKYQERGYRFILLEAGHVAQNMNLVAVALGLSTVNIGGFFDRAIDELIGIDGLTHSTLYLVAVGKKPKPKTL